MNAVFIHIPKTAGSYVMVALGFERLIYPHRVKTFKQKGMVSFGHQDYLRLVRKGIVGKEFDESAFKFAFVRNPFDRVVSHYFWTRKRHPDILPGSVIFLEFTRQLKVINEPHSILTGGNNKNLKWWRTNRFKLQSIQTEGINMDFIGHYERLDDDLKKVAKIIGVEIKPTPRIRATKHNPYYTYYNDESEDNVRQYYAKDFIEFGYANRLSR